MITERDKILFITEQFIKGIRKNSFDGLEEYFDKDVYVSTSTLGTGQGIEAMKHLLKYTGPKIDIVKQNIENIILHYHNNQASQSFHLIQCYVKYDNQKKFHFLQIGGTYVLNYTKIKNDWYISSIKYDLCWFDGNNYWIKDWKLIDFKMPKRHVSIINSQVDGVHHCFYESDDNMNEYQMIEELGYIYGWVIDTEDYPLLERKTTDDFVVYDGYHHNEFKGCQEWIEFLKQLNQKEPCLHHTYQVKSIEVDENKAILKMSRLEPNRIGSRVIGENTWFYDWNTLDYTIDVIKENEEWLLQKVSFITRIHEEKSRGYFEEDIA